jgi:hypothetical protein
MLGNPILFDLAAIEQLARSTGTDGQVARSSLPELRD